MSGRAVGGAAGAGCGAFTLVGLLVGVGLTLWLGSQVLDRALPSPGASSDRPRPATVADGAIRLGVAGPVADGTEVAVAGTELPPGALELSACLGSAPAGHEGRACDLASTTGIAVGDDGTFLGALRISRSITIDEIAYDCAAFVGACEVVAHPVGAPDDGTTAALTLDAPAPISAERPPGG